MEHLEECHYIFYWSQRYRHKDYLVNKMKCNQPNQWLLAALGNGLLGVLIKHALGDLLYHALDVPVQTVSMECMFELALI